MSPAFLPPDLKGRVAVVAGATRGVGRGAALALGEAGAIVYCTGRSTKANRLPRSPSRKTSPFDYSRRPETVQETAELVTARGGKGFAVILDHTDAKQVEKLVGRIRKEQGQLHIVVNDISEIIPQDLGKTFWQLNLENGFANLRNALHTHIITNHYAAPLLIETGNKSGHTGLIVGIGDGNFYTYRGHLFYDLVKTSVIRMAFGMARELAAEKCRCRSADARIPAIRSDARAFRSHGGKLAGGHQKRPALCQLRDAALCGARDRRVGRGPRPDEEIRTSLQLLGPVRRVRILRR